MIVTWAVAVVEAIVIDAATEN